MGRTEALQLGVQRILRHSSALLFAGANLILQATVLVCQFWVLRFIPPQEMGAWAFTALVEQYLLVTQLGILNAMNREYPFYMGRGETGKAMAVLRTAQTYAVGNGLLLGLVFFVLAFVYRGHGPEWFAALLTWGACLPLIQYSSYLEGTYRAGSEFRALSWIRLAQAALQWVTMLLLVLLPQEQKFNGYCGRVFLLTLQPALMCHVWRPVRVRLGFDWRQFRELFGTGWRLYIWNYANRTAHSFPRLALATLSGTLFLGLFTPVSAAYAAVSGIAGSINAYLYPNLTRRYAQDGSSVGHVALKASLLVMAVLVLPVVIGVLLMPAVVPRLLPMYQRAVPAAQLALLASLLECMTIATVTFAAMKAWRWMFAYIACSLVSRAAGAFLGHILMEDRLLGVAWGTLAASGLMVGVTWITVSRTARGSTSEYEVSNEERQEDADSGVAAVVDRHSQAGGHDVARR